jgi:hypothetical protein
MVHHNILFIGRRLALGLTFLAVAASGSLAAEELVDNDLGFSLVIPDRFTASPEALGVDEDIVHAFTSGDPQNGYIMLFIEKLGGTIGRELVKREDLPEEFSGRVATTRWKEFDVSVVYILETADDVSFVTLNAQIPLRRQAIQVKLFGPAEREAEMTELLDELLANLEGETNWNEPELAGKSNGSSRLRIVPLRSVTGLDRGAQFGIAIAFGVIGLVIYWLISQKGPKWALLATAVGVWAVGRSMRKSDVSEIVLLSSTCSLLGLAGGLLGLGDLFFRKKRRRNSEEGRNDVVDAEVIDDT